METRSTRNGSARNSYRFWDDGLNGILKRQRDSLELSNNKLKRPKPIKYQQNEIQEEGSHSSTTAKKRKPGRSSKKKVSRSEKSSPKSKQSKQLQPKYSKAKSRSLPSSPQGELNDEYFDEYENVEETLKVYTASDGKISAFWTIPTKYIRNVLENSHQFDKFYSIAFPAKAASNKKWNLQLLLTRDPDDSDFCDRLEIVLNAIPSPQEIGEKEWVRETSFTMLVAQKDGDLSCERQLTRRFDEKNTKWGLLIEKYKLDLRLKSPLVIGCMIKPEKPMRFADAKYVGLVNAGNTCYMNSFLQTLFHLSSLVRLVFQVPFSSETPLSIPSAMQKLFYELMNSGNAVRTTELTKSFGWESKQTKVQQDVQEFCCLLLEALDAKTRGIKGVEGEINKLFEGKTVSYIKCLNVGFQSRREEPFKEIQLQVKGFSNIYESLDSYIQEELLDGDNAYDTEKYGKQPARKGVRFCVNKLDQSQSLNGLFQKFPPVLMIHLKRFEYEYQLDRNVKICDGYEYFPEIDLSKYLENPPKKPEKYHLYSVLVHSGTGAAAGHYYAFLRPEKGGEWYKFNDEYVDEAQEDEVYDANFGGTFIEAKMNKITKEIETKEVMSNRTAYMLVYISENFIQEALRPLSDTDIPEAFVNEITAQKKIEEEKKNKTDNSLKIYITSFDLLEDIDTPGLTHYRSAAFNEDACISFSKDKTKRYKLRLLKTHKLTDLLDAITGLSGIPSNDYHLFRISARDEKITLITKREKAGGAYSLNTLINGVSSMGAGNQRNIVLMLPINRKKYPRIFVKDTENTAEKGNRLKFCKYEPGLFSIANSQMLIESTPDFPGNTLSQSNHINEETDASIYEEILQETRLLVFIKIYFNQNHKGRIKMLEYVFMRNKDQISTVIPYLEKTHPEVLWEDPKIYREHKKRYTLEPLALIDPIESLDLGDILLFDVGLYQSSPPYLPAVDHYEELNNQINVKFFDAKTELSTSAVLSKKMTLAELYIYISNEYYDGTVEPEKILLKAKYKTSQNFVQVVSSTEANDGRSLTLGDLTRFDETIIYEESQVPVSDLSKYIKLMVSYYSICTNETTREAEIYIGKQATVKDLVQKITQEKLFDPQLEIDKRDLSESIDRGCDTLIVTVHEKNGKIMMKCPEDIEVKAVMKKGRLRVQFWSSELGSDEIEAFCYHLTRDGVNFGTAFLTKFKRYFTAKMIRTHLYNQMNDWELKYSDKKVKMTPEYMQKLRITIFHETPKDSYKPITLEEDNELSANAIYMTKGSLTEIQILHSTVLFNVTTAMKIS